MAVETTAAVQSAGAMLSVAASPPAASVDTAVEFAGLAWTEVGEITNYGEFGRQYQLVTHNPVKNRKTFKFKGARNDGALALQMARAPSDAGQAILMTALDSDSKYAFRIQYGDQPGGSPASPTSQYFRGLVMSYTTNPNDVNSIIAAAVQVEIDGDIIEVAAAS